MVAAHGLGGWTGALLTGVLASAAWGGTPGLLEGNAALVGKQAIAIVATFLYSGAATWGLLKLLAFVLPLRADSRLQGRGLDIELHGEEAYGSGEGAILVLDPLRPAAPRPASASAAEAHSAGALGAGAGA